MNFTNRILSKYLPSFSAFSWRRFVSETFEVARQGVALLLVYATVAATMPVRADELAGNFAGRTNSAAVSQSSFFRTQGTTTNGPGDWAAIRTAGIGKDRSPVTAQSGPLMALAAPVGLPLPGKAASLRSAVPHLFASFVGAGTSSSIQSNFNGTAIGAGKYIWFNSVLKPSGLGSSTVNIYLRSSTITFTANGNNYYLPVPGATITYSPSATTATTTFDTTTNQWLTTVPTSASGNGNTFLTGLSFPVPAGGLPGGINPVTWQGQFYTDTTGVTLNWQWAAAVYSTFTTTYSNLGVKPVDSNSASQYKNSDHAGTPESYKSYVIGGAQGGGGSNYTGSYSGTAAVNPVVGTPDTPIANAGPNQTVYASNTVQLNGTGSSDPAGLALTYSWSLVSVPTGSTAKLNGATSATPTFVADKTGSYTAQLIVNNGYSSSAPSAVVITSQYSTPVANAGSPQTVYVGATVQLNGSASSDPAGLPLTYAWSFASKPTGSAATLSGATTVNPTFVADKTGSYTVQLVVNNGHNSSSPSTVPVTSQYSTPVANAGPPQTVYVGTTVQLDGTGSSDPAGAPLTYQWSFVLPLPAGSTASLNNSAAPKPTFVTDKAGTYKVQLVVNNGHNSSAPSTVSIASQNQPPFANAGPPQTVYEEATVQLNGTGSYDPAGLSITYQWSFASVPSGSNATLTGATTATPTFVADKTGKYNVQLVVNNGVFSSMPSTVPITTLNSPPVANAGPNQSVPLYAVVQLDGGRSTDVDGDPLTYSWSLTSVPTGSKAALSSATIVNPTFTVDVKGTYVAQLIVNDGVSNSAPSTVMISTVNTPPVANAGPNQSLTVLSTVQLDGSKSTDIDGNSLTYSWSFLTVPTGSKAVLSNPNAVQPTFVADVLGTYIVQLVVNDGTVNSTPSTVLITNGDVPPVANPGPGQTVHQGSLVNLNGSASTDSDGQPLTYQWSLLSVPLNSTAVLAQPTSMNPYFTADLAGNYVVQLIVNDGYLNSAPATVTISTGDTAPVANAGPNQIVTVGASVQLSGAASSDAEGNPLTYKWAILTQPNGGTAVLSSTTVVNPTIVVNVAGLYVAQLIVNDGYLSSQPATTTITAIAQPPVVNAGPNQTITLPVNSVTLNGTATDNGLPLTINWTEVSGPPGVTFGTPSQAVTTATFPGAGTYVLQLTASASQLSSSATTTVTVNPATTNPPLVYAGPNQTVPYPNFLPLQGSVTSANNPPGTVTALWTELSGPPVTFVNAASPTTLADFKTAGTYVLQLTGTEKGLSASSTVTITAIQGNQPPIVNAGPDQSIPLPTTTATLIGSATDDGRPAGSTLTYQWSLVAGPGTATFANPTSLATTVTFSTKGVYTLRLTVSDSQLTGSADTHVTVVPQNQPPVVSAGPNQTIALPVNSASLQGTVTDDGLPLGAKLMTAWSMVSGPGLATFTNPNNPVTTAAFAVPGVYDLRLSASDTQYTSTADVKITVLASIVVPPGSIAITPTSLSPIPIGTSESFQAVVLDENGAPVANVTVIFTVSGANQYSGNAVTDANGRAVFSYTGYSAGLDSLIATATVKSNALQSNAANINWVALAPPVSVSAITGQFFPSDGSGSFDITPNTPPVFTQTFNAVLFNPPAGTVNGAPASIDVTTRPFTNVTTDANGSYTGAVIAQGNGYQAGQGSLAAFQAVFTGTFTAAAAGHVTFVFYDADGFVFGVGNGAQRVSGTFVYPPTSGSTAFNGYAVMGSFNTATVPVANTITVNFPAPGTYPFELDYAASSQDALIPPGSLWRYSLNNPAGFQLPTFDDSSFAEGLAPFTNAVGAQSPGFNCPLIGATNFPVNGTVDLRRTINLPNSASNVTAYVAIDNDFTLWINGTQVANIGTEFCAYEWKEIVPIPDNLWVQGSNVVAVQARDRGGATGFEMQMIEGAGGIGQGPKGLTLTMTVDQNSGQAGVTLYPASKVTKNLGQAVTMTAAVTDNSGRLLPNQSVTFNVAGPNTQQAQSVTDANGNATFNYVGGVLGSDTVQAQSLVEGMTVVSSQTTIQWARPTNQPPMVYAGPNQIVDLPNSVNLDGSVTDDGLPVGAVVTQEWSQTGGPVNAGTNGYAFEQTITINHSKIANTDQQDFPVLISGFYPFLASVPYGGNVQNSNGWDIVFTSDAAGQNKLDHEIDSYDPTTGTVNFWVRIPTLSHTTDTVIYMLYGNAAVMASQENKAGVWKNNYLSVYHLGNGSAVGVSDSGSAGYNLAGSVTPASGKISGGVSLNGSGSNYLYYENPTNYPTGTSPVTIEAWFQLATATGGFDIVGYGANSYNGSRVALGWDGSNGLLEFENMSVSGPLAFDTNWHHMVGVYGGGGLNLSTSQLYLDGALISNSTSSGTPGIATNEFKIGGIPTVTFCCAMTGLVDEVRVSSGTRSADWITTEYTNQSSPSTFYSIRGGVTFSAPNQAQTQVSFSTPGTYTLQLAASDTQFTSTSQVTVLVNGANSNQPPVVNAGPSQLINLPNTATLSGSVTGSYYVIQWTELSGPGSVSFANPGQPVTTASFSQPGTYVLQLSASNTQYQSIASTTIAVYPASNPHQNQPPTVSANVAAPVLAGVATALSGTATDDGLPNGTITIEWAQISGPATVTFNNPVTTAQGVTSSTTVSSNTQAVFPAVGTYVLQMGASDSQYTSNVTLTVPVTVPQTVNQAPVVTAGTPQTIVLPTSSATLNGIASDDGLPNGTLTTLWTLVSGPAAVTFANPNAAATNANFSAAGVYLLQLSASDGQYTTSATTTVTVNAQQQQGVNQPPTVNAGGNQTIYLPNTTVTLSGQVADDGLPQGSTLSIAWSKISGPATVSFSNATQAVTQASFSQAGTYVLALTASDSQLQTTAQVTILVATSPGQPPTVSITAPMVDAELTAPTAVTGSVSNGNWLLQYAPTNELNPQAQQWTTFASGSGSASGSLAKFDPTLLLNGEYTIQLVATDNFGQSASTSVTVEVGRNMKLGAFSISFQDLSVPLPGLPITITRTYDSRDRTQGDFGDGWRLSIANVRVQKNGGPLGLTWDEEVSWSGLSDQYCLQSARNHTVTATFPDGRVYRFAPSTSTVCQLFAPIDSTNMTFVQVPTSANTSGATLAPADGGAVLVDGSIPGPQNLLDYNGNPYDPTQFLLTTADGYTYSLDQKLGVTQVRDLNGNTLTINSSGVVSSAGKSVAFTRDGQGRITQVADPSGAYLTYSYSGAGDLASVTDRAQNTTTFGYDGNHYLLNISDPRGTPAVRSTYDPSGRLLTTTDASGKTINYMQNIAGQIEQVQDRLGNTTTYAYDADGNILSMTDPLGNTMSYTYDSFDNKLTETNALHKTTTYTYDGLGNRLTEADPLGNTTTYTYNQRNQVLTVTDPQGHTTTNVYDANGNLLTSTDANGKTTTTVYAANGLPTSVTDAANNVTQFQYDGSGNLTQQTDALNHVSTYTYDANGNKLSQTVTRTVNGSPQTLTTGYQYDGNNRVTKTTYPDGSTTQVQYNSIGKQSATIDQLNRTTSYAYNADGNLITTTYPDTTTESTTYDANNNRLTSTDRAGHTTTYTYDADNRLTQTTYADSKFTKTHYDAAGRVDSTTDANGNVTAYSYDDAGRRTTITDALNHVTTFGYDNAGNQVSVKDAKQNTTQYQYDSLNRQTKVIYPDQTFSATVYDALGRVSSKTDQAGKVTGYGYDALGRLASVTQDAGGLNLVTSYGYDEVGNRVSQTDANNHATTYAYDQLGRRIKRTLPAGQSESYTYDAAGNLKTKVDFNSKTTTYAYDTSNRLLSKTPDSSFHAQPIAFTYFANGLRQTMADPSGTTTYTYDNRNRLTSKQTPFGTLAYTYDNAGDLLKLKSSNTHGISDTYTYDVLNRLSTVTDPAGATTYSFDAVGNLQSFTYPNGVASSYNYDTLNRLTQMGSAKGSALSGYTYTLGAAGNRTNVAELSGRNVAYLYDALYRLTSETVTADPHNHNVVNGYIYDSVGNRQQWLVNGVTTNTYTYDADDRLSADTYDANGNTVLSTGVSDSYDFENHLVQKGAVTIVYDGDGNRVSETVGGVTTNYLVDTANPTGYAQVVDELQSGAVTRSYSYGMERISENQTLNSSWTPSFYGYDGHGSVRQLTNSAGAITDTYDYDAFGNLTNSTGTTPNNYLFASQQYDGALGLYYNRARYLNTSTGRFWSMDTDEGQDELPTSLHKYLYVSSNPVNKRDISGHSQLLETEEVAADEDTIGAAEDEGYQGFLRFLQNARSTALATGLKAGFTLTLAGAILLGSVGSLFSGNPAESEDLMLRNGHNTDGDQQALFAFGSKTAPRAPRLGNDIHPDPDGMVGPTDPPEGASAFANVRKSGLTGYFHGITLGDVWATDGLSAIADGSDVKPGSSNPETHFTIYPARRMNAQEFIDKFLNLPWQLAGSQ